MLCMGSEFLLVSVIIPTRNSGFFIRAALEGLFDQTYPAEKTEIIVVDDGSTDNTFGVLKEYGGNISYVRQENKGIASARNKGVTLAKGDIITFLDADDIWHRERLQKVVERFNEKENSGIVYHPVGLIDSMGNTIHENFYKAFGYVEGISGRITNEIFCGRIFCGGSSFAFRRAVISRVCPLPEDIRRGVDYYMTALCSCLTETEYIPDILGKYRFHGSNTTLFAGRDDVKELAITNRDFAHMRQRVIDKVSGFAELDAKVIDLSVIKRIQAKENIFFHVLNGSRMEGIRHLPSLFKCRPGLQDLLRGLMVSLMALIIPAAFYSRLMKLYEILKRTKMIKF